MRGIVLAVTAGLLLISAPAQAADPIEIRRNDRPTSGPRLSAFNPATLEGNEICRDSYVSELSVQDGIQGIPVNSDYCELPSGELPSEIVLILGTLRKIHERYAQVVGIEPARLYGSGVPLRLAGNPAGSFISWTRYEIEIDVFSDFRAELFPEKIYAHELTHWLGKRQGSLGDAIQMLEPSYLFQEGFPDLVASYVSQSPKIDIQDSSIRSELMSSLTRDGTPLKTMKFPFRYFYFKTFESTVRDVCRSIPWENRTGNENSLCEVYELEAASPIRQGGPFASALTLLPSSATLELPFNPKKCLIRYKDGSTGLGACSIYSFSTVLISFFRSIDSVLGERPMARVIESVEKAAANAGVLTCRFSEKDTESVMLKIPSFVSALQYLRASLPEEGRRLFDEQWNTHGLESWRRIEGYDRKYVDEPFTVQQLFRRNEEFVTKNHCEVKTRSKQNPECQPTCSFVPAVK